jgi:excisionase family DNA binding protein
MAGLERHVPGGSQGVPDLVFDKLVWTFEDVAKELNCSVRLVQKLVAEERIPYAKVGRLVRFSRARIHEWLQKGGNR